MEPLYRLYIDEVGNHDLRPDLDENERFLSLFGVAIVNQHMVDVIQPEMWRIKSEYFLEDPDTPVIFHRKEITRYQGLFKSLYADREKRLRFGNVMLDAYRRWEYVAFLVTIDKRTHYNTYSVWRYEPYHYCLMAMLERYVRFLRNKNMRGDVMIESRGRDPNQRLESSFRRLITSGTRHVSKEQMQQCLTSVDIKIREKKADIAGLQLADLLAHAAHYEHLAQHNLVAQQESGYSSEIALILKQWKYDRQQGSGKIEGYGKKLLP